MAYKLIVADRSPSVQKAIQMAFSDSEFEIYPFDDGLEVVESLSQINPDAVLLSLSLPHKDGYEVGFLMKSQEKFRHISLILLKGAFEPLNKEKIAGLDYDEIVQEPFDSERLVRMVRDLIEKKRNPQTLPEEPLLDEVPVTESSLNPEEEDSTIEALSQDVAISGKKSLSSHSPEWKAVVEENVKDLVREEILNVERELEKRIRAKVLAELKDLIKKEIKRDEKQK